ncbi:McrB family protein [Vibrio harveyi]|uniref:McrB family protein n=1 Tax=Vibrio harveyi TaxID=669 RepID=UPI003CF7FB43
MYQINSLQQLWDEFLAEWPLERIKTMTLQEYVSTQDKTTFTYWLETKTQPLANIKGSPSPKFGIYKRNSEPKERSGMAHGSEYSWWEKLGSTEQEAFETVRSEIVRVINAVRVGDLTTVDSAKLAPVYKWKIAFMYQVQSVPTIVNIFAKDKLSELTDLPKSSSYPELYLSLMKNYDTEQHANIAEYGRMCWSQLEHLENKEQPSTEPANTSVGSTVMSPLNQILYGPPGTGKTYHTVEAAVTAAEPTFGWANRSELKEKYDQLVADKRIRFVTFHQSYGYEEFVEGLSASTTDGDQVKYSVKEGIFKEIADAARKNLEDSHRDQQSLDREQKFDLALEAFKLSIFEESDSFSLTDAVSIISIEDEGFRYCGEWKSSQIMKFADLKSLYLSAVQTRQDVKRIESVSGLARQHATYFFKALKQIETFVSNELPSSKRLEKQNYVLVMDEINRGNISKIFGELITLIEPSKRKGSDEFIELTLPQSKTPFSVPNNLYLIGTMNTADRSLAMMDTALRRRFDFVEMMPKPSLLKGCVVKNADVEINLSELLTRLNERIEILYDREHTLGHAFFMPVKSLIEAGEQGKAFNALVSVFKNKIIPLLEEYFFEDWSKIRLVLADNQKPEHLQFVEEKEQKAEALRSLFGKGHNLDQYGQSVVKYSLAAEDAAIWNNAKAYLGIYQPTEEASTKSPESKTEADVELS